MKIRRHIFKFHRLSIDLAREQVFRGGIAVPLQPVPMKALMYLAQTGGRLVSRDELRRHLWPNTVVEYDKSLNVCIREIRRALDDNARAPSYLETVHGKGYRFIGHVDLRARERLRTTLFRPFRLEAVAIVVLLAGGVLLLQSNAGSSTPRARTIDESSPALEYYLQGKAHLTRNYEYSELQRAVEKFSAAIALDSGLTDAYAGLAMARAAMVGQFGERGYLEEAELATERALNMEPNSPNAHLARGYTFFYGYRDYPRALESFERAIAAAPRDAETVFSIGLVLTRLGRTADALDYFQTALYIDPQSVVSAYELGNAYMSLGHYAQAGLLFEKVQALYPNHFGSYIAQAMLPVLEGDDLRQGVRSLQRAERTFRISPVALISPLLARTYAQLYADHTDRLTLEDWSLDDGEFYAHKGMLMMSLGRMEAALALFDSSRVVIEPRIVESAVDPGLLSRDVGHLAYSYAVLGRAQEAVSLVDRMVANASFDRAPQYRVRLMRRRAEILAIVGRNEEAVVTLEQIVGDVNSGITQGVLLLDPVWNSLRGDPRFELLLDALPDTAERALVSNANS